MSQYNNKQFLQVSCPDEISNEISLVYLDLDLNKVQHTDPSSNQIIYNLNGYPEQWMFLKKGKQTTFSLENSQNSDATIVEFLNMTTKNEKQKKANKTNKDKIITVTRIMARIPPKKSYNFEMMKNIANIMENFKLNETHQKLLDEYLYPEPDNFFTSQKNTFQNTPEKDLQKERPLHISDLFIPNQPQTLYNPNDLLSNPKQTDNEIGTTIPNQKQPHYETSTTRPLLISSNNKPITKTHLNLDVSEIKPLGQSSHMMIDDQTIYDISSKLESNQLLNKNITWDSSFDKEFRQEPNTQLSNNSLDKNLEKELQKTRDIKAYNNAKKDIQTQAMKLIENLGDIENITEILIEIKSLPILPPYFYEPIFNKLNYKDRTFFKSFTNNPTTKPPHQKEFQELEDNFIDNYKKDHKLSFINYITKRKIRTIICSILTITFLRSIDLTKLRYYQITQLMEYLINYFIRKQEIRVDYTSLLNKIKEEFEEKLPILPTNPQDIPQQIKIKLPTLLPMYNKIHLIQTIRNLRPYYQFDKLPESYFKKLPPLPEDPFDLLPEFAEYFPITQRNKLIRLQYFKEKLKESYDFKGRLPNEYFDMPPPKKPLPTTHQLLESKFHIFFPYNPLTCPVTFSELIILLRKTYYFKLLPNDFFFIKPRLISPESIKELPEFNHLNLSLPTTNWPDTYSLLNFLKTRFEFKSPLTKEWINIQLNKQKTTDKPSLPTDMNEVNKIAGTTYPIKNKKDLLENIKKTGNHFSFQRIPDLWIQIIQKPTLPDIPNLKTYIEKNNLNIQIPILHDESFPSKIRLLREHFAFQRLSSEYITTPDLPEPTITQFNFSWF